MNMPQCCPSRADRVFSREHGAVIRTRAAGNGLGSGTFTNRIIDGVQMATGQGIERRASVGVTTRVSLVCGR